MGQEQPMKAGGQALADGVFMRTERAWAIARADGSVEVGEVGPNRLARIPVLRILSALGRAMALGIGKGILGGRKKGSGRKANKRFLLAMLAIQAAVLAAGWALDPISFPWWTAPIGTVAVWTVMLAALRVMSPQELWRYHGAEHKAVAALESGIDLHDTEAVLACDRIHNRCGTNLVFVVAAMTSVPAPIPTWLQPFAFLLAFAAVAELVTLAAAHPRFWISRAMLAGGRWLQRRVTTLEPSFDEQVVGCRALIAAVEEQRRIEALESAEAIAPDQPTPVRDLAPAAA